MRKLVLLSLALMLSGNVFLTSCSDEEAQISVEDRMLNDDVFTHAVTSTVDLFLTAQDNDWAANGQAIRDLMRIAEERPLTADEAARLNQLLGMDRETFLQRMTDYTQSMQLLLEKYPELEGLDTESRRALFASAVSESDVLASYMGELYTSSRACFLQDLCNLVVDLAVIIGGPILCDIIAGAIPIIGPLLCDLVLDIGTDILVGICNGLPC